MSRIHVLFAWVLFFSPTLAVAGGLDVRNVNAKEGAGAFSLQVQINDGSPINDYDDEYYSGTKKPATEFDAVRLYDFVRVQPPAKFSILGEDFSETANLAHQRTQAFTDALLVAEHLIPLLLFTHLALELAQG